MSGRLDERPCGRAGDTVSVIGMGGSYLDTRSPVAAKAREVARGAG